MKFKLPIGVCVLISLALVAFGLLFGTLSGFSDERAQVEALLSGDNGLLDVLDYRGADGLNLCVVAARHLPDSDSELTALRTAAKTLRATNDLAQKKAADEQLETAFAALADKLGATPGFVASERDQKYLDMLSADMRNLRSSEAVSTYNRAAADYNAQLTTPVAGALARLLGVQPMALYE